MNIETQTAQLIAQITELVKSGTESIPPLLQRSLESFSNYYEIKLYGEIFLSFGFAIVTGVILTIFAKLFKKALSENKTEGYVIGSIISGVVSVLFVIITLLFCSDIFEYIAITKEPLGYLMKLAIQ